MRQSRVAGIVGTGILLMGVGSAGAAEKGQIGVSVGAGSSSDRDVFGVQAVDPTVSFSYQLSDRISLRPGLSSLGRSSIGGWFFGVGGTALYHLRPGRRHSPYFGLGLRYNNRGRPFDIEGLFIEGLVLEPDLSSRRYTTFSAMAGTEYTVGRRLSFFAEIEGSYSTGRHYRSEGDTWRLGEGAFKVRPVVGLTLKLR